MPLSVKIVNNTKKKEKEMTKFIFIDIAWIKTQNLFMLTAIKKNLVVQQLCRNLRYAEILERRTF